MLGFEVRINNQAPIRIGADNAVYVILTYGYPRSGTIYLGGSDCRCKYSWLREHSKKGAKVVIKVIETDQVSPVVEAKDWDRSEMKERFERLKTELGERGLI